MISVPRFIVVDDYNHFSYKRDNNVSFCLFYFDDIHRPLFAVFDKNFDNFETRLQNKNMIIYSLNLMQLGQA